MTDTFIEVQGDPAVGGQVGEDGADAQIEPSILNIDEFKDYHVPLKVDGEEVKVPLSEAVAGYQRHADYTRKTQELAQQRQELGYAAAIRQALETDPRGTLELLGRHYGVTVGAAQQPKLGDEFSYGNDQPDAWTEPADPRYQQLEERLQRFEQAQAENHFRSELQRLQTTYGDDFNPQEVVAAAVRLGTTDLESTFKQIHFDRLIASERQRREAERAAEAKREAAVVSGGSSAAGGLVEPPPIRSIRDAWLSAKAELGE